MDSARSVKLTAPDYYKNLHLLGEEKTTLKNCKIIARNVSVEVIFKFFNVL